MADDDATTPEDAPAEEPAEETEPTAEETEPTADEPAPDEEPTAEEPVEQPPAEESASQAAYDDIVSQIQAIPVASFLLSTLTTLASIAYGKLASGELDEARAAIDAIAALAPVLEGRIEPGIKRDFEQALANLQLAYADASAKTSS